MDRTQGWLADAMTVDREGSPSTVRGESPPPLYAIDDEEATQDFMTDEQFAATFPQATNTAQSETPAVRYRILDTFSTNGQTYRKGKTVEVQDGDFIRTIDVLEDQQSKAIFLRGQRFRRISRFRGLFDLHLNEVVMLVEYTEQEALSRLPQADLSIIPISDALKIRELILTNEAYPIYSYKESRQNRGLPRAVARESCRLVCRWKVLMTYRMKTNRKACVAMTIPRLRTDDSDHNYRARDEDLREEFRGKTIKGGSCPAWLEGEEQFDRNERGPTYGVDTLGYHRQRFSIPRDGTIDLTADTSQRPRYTVGDAFCGAGGASRGAKTAGFRVEWGVDFDPTAIQTYSQNFFLARCEATPVDVFVTYMEENYVVDVLHLSPPCKTFSPAHTRPVEALLKKTKPRIVTMENTFGLVERWRDWLHCMIRFFTALGFSVCWKVFNLAEYGLPQARRRLIVIASWYVIRFLGIIGGKTAYRITSPGEKLPSFPEPTHGPNRLPFTTVNNAIARIPPGFPNHDVRGAPRRNASPYNGDLPLRNCITTGGSLDIHPSGERAFTDRELACLQGFPLEHTFGMSKVKMQIGNALTEQSMRNIKLTTHFNDMWDRRSPVVEADAKTAELRS
ncbi:MAG: hypothetical protein LQ338_005303 [Usnochroma carphineum]|nr:MAG: hypothetical protein LQ338_005303 [Usnochroma carphineum]